MSNLKKVRIEMTLQELAVVRALLGKCNDTLQVGELFNKVADKCDALYVERVELSIHEVDGVKVEWYSIGKQ